MEVDSDGNYYILLDSRFSSEDWKYDLTESFTHELTHLKDYLSFAKCYCNINYVDIPKHEIIALNILYIFSKGL